MYFCSPTYVPRALPISFFQIYNRVRLYLMSNTNREAPHVLHRSVLLLTSRYLPQHPFLQYLPPTFLPSCDRPSLTPVCMEYTSFCSWCSIFRLVSRLSWFSVPNCATSDLHFYMRNHILYCSRVARIRKSLFPFCQYAATNPAISIPCFLRYSVPHRPQVIESAFRPSDVRSPNLLASPSVLHRSFYRCGSRCFW